jgi:hypothetical protein
MFLELLGVLVRRCLPINAGSREPTVPLPPLLFLADILVEVLIEFLDEFLDEFLIEF